MRFASMAAAALAAATMFAATSTPKGWTDDYDAALSRASAEGKLILVDFSGSDWCGWCKKLDKEVFSKDEFLDAAAAKYVLLMVDSPRDNSLLSDKAKEQNPKLVEKFGIKGFPTVLVLDAKGEELVRIMEQEHEPAKYLEMLESEIRDAPDVKKYIRPIEDILNRHDKEMESDMEAIGKEIAEKFQKPSENATNEERRRLQKEAMAYGQKAFLQKLEEKYIPLYEKAFAEARAAEVPERMKKRKDDLIEAQEGRFVMLKNMVEGMKAKKASENGEESSDEDDEADDDDDDVDEEDDDEEWEAPKRTEFQPPLPADAKTETQYFREVAEPFYRRHIVETYDAASETNAEVRAKILQVRECLAHRLATHTPLGFPLDVDKCAADWLWDRGVRDAAVALVRFDGQNADYRFWHGERHFKEACAAHDDKKEPILAMLMRRRWFEAIKNHNETWPDYRPDKMVKDAYRAYEASFEPCVEILKAADPRIAEWMDMDSPLPVGSGEKLGNEYLACCQRAEACKDSAFASRGTGWASEVTEEGWKGWRASNETAETNLLRAVELKGDRARPALMLADLYGRSCGRGDAITWMNRGVSNSLDEAAQRVEAAIHFQMSRWGGSSRILEDIAMKSADSVRTDSLFALRAAFRAVANMIEYDNEGDVRGEVYKRVINPRLRESLYRMIDAYIAAKPSPDVPRPDVFRQVGVNIALQVGDWDRAAAYAAAIEKGVTDEREQLWVRIGTASEEKIFTYNLMQAFGRLDRDGRLAMVAAERAREEGRHDESYAFYEKWSKKQNLSYEEKVLCGGRVFGERAAMQEAAGGWIDLMPTKLGGNLLHFWGLTELSDDGRVRKVSDWRSHALSMQSVHGLGSEFEATVYFEENKKDQKEWNIGWGWARSYTCNASSWAYPYIHFSRDEKGDHVEIDRPTRENQDAKHPDDRDNKLCGRSPAWRVFGKDLERKPSHAFRAVFGDEEFFVEVDGEKVYSVPMQELMSSTYQRDRVQPNGDVFPVWKLYDNTAYSGYRYRRLKGTQGAATEKDE